MNGALKGIQLILGILLGFIGLGAIAGGIGYYFLITQLSTRPPKPVFAEERKDSKLAAKIKTKTKPKTAIATAPSPSPNSQDGKKDNPADQLPPSAYSAKVIWKDGLSLKKEPSVGTEKVGGVGYNEKVAIIKESEDKQWLLIRSENGGTEGWVKAGNIDRSGQEEPEETKKKPEKIQKINSKVKATNQSDREQ